MSDIPEEVGKVLKECGLGRDAVWSLERGGKHRGWIVKHWALERAAAHKGIVFDTPVILEANGGEKVAAMLVTGRLGEAVEWSTGEASPHNYKTSGKMDAFPWAMAEKRGKDRVILKLLQLHGEVYSEAESDDFQRIESDQNPDKDGAGKYIMTGALTKTGLQQKMKEFCADVALAEDTDMLAGVMDGYKEAVDQCKADWPQLWDGIPEKEWVGAGERYDAKWKELLNKDDLRAAG